MADTLKPPPAETHHTYALEEQIGFVLRKASQRHIGIFAARVDDLTPTQFAAMAKVYEMGPVSQNALGRMTAMDAATIKGVIDRLQARGLLVTETSPTDRRRLLVRLTEDGRRGVEAAIPQALQATRETLAPLDPSEREMLMRLLERLA